MSKKILTIVVILTLLLIVFVFFKGSEKSRIKNQLDLIVKKTEKKVGDKTIFLATKLNGIEKLFCSECLIEIPSYGFKGNVQASKIISKILMAQKVLKTFKVNFYDIKFNYINENDASLNATIDIKGKGRRMKRFEIPHELEIKAVKKDGNWIFCQFSEVVFLEK